MKAIVYFTFSKKGSTKEIVDTLTGDKFEIYQNIKSRGIYIFQIIKYGYMTMKDKEVAREPIEIDFDKYSEIDVVFPIWAGRMPVYVKKFFKDNLVENKKIRYIATSDSGSKMYLNNVEISELSNNNIVEKIMYKKGKKQT